MKRILLLVMLVGVGWSESYSQAGMWTWINGSDTIRSVGHYGIQGVPSAHNSPPALYEPCEWKDFEGNFWIFGGVHQTESRNPMNGDFSDLWKYNPKTNEWSWIKGPGIPNDRGYYGTKGISSPLNNPANRGWGVPSWVDKAGNLWLYSGSIRHADMWKYSISTNEWTWMHGDTVQPPFSTVAPNYGAMGVASESNTPGSRLEVSTAWTDNDGNLWLFGGGSADSSRQHEIFCNDLWKYDVSINQWIWMKGPKFNENSSGSYGVKGVSSPTNFPPARAAYARWKDEEGNFFLFGGIYEDIQSTCIRRGFSDVWKYEIMTNNWVWVSGDSSSNNQGYAQTKCQKQEEAPRNNWENRSVCFDRCGNVFMFGGLGIYNCYSQIGPINELWHYNTSTNKWTIIKTSTAARFGTKFAPSILNAPPRKAGSVAWLGDNSLWVFGGQDGSGGGFNDLWKFTLDSNCIEIKSCSINCSAGSVNIVQNGNELSSFGASSYQWYHNGSKINGATNAVYVANEPGAYTLEITDGNGCTAKSTPVLISGLDEIESEAVSIYPNPSSVASFQLAVASSLVGSNLEVYDANGRMVFQTTINQQQTTLSPSLSAGVYFIRIQSEKVSIIRKWVRL